MVQDNTFVPCASSRHAHAVRWRRGACKSPLKELADYAVAQSVHRPSWRSSCLSMPTLFGGALELALPERFEDISSYRDVPDNQEVAPDRPAAALSYVFWRFTGSTPCTGGSAAACRYFVDIHLKVAGPSQYTIISFNMWRD